MSTATKPLPRPASGFCIVARRISESGVLLHEWVMADCIFPERKWVCVAFKTRAAATRRAEKARAQAERAVAEAKARGDASPIVPAFTAVAANDVPGALLAGKVVHMAAA